MLKKSILPLSLLVVVAGCQANEASVLANAKKNYNHAVAAVGEAETSCKKSEVNLPGRLFKNLDIPDEHLKVSLKYFYFKSNVDCTNNAVKNFLVASVVLSSLDSQQQEDLQQANQLIAMANVHLIETEAEYMALPEKSRKALNVIPELKSPFSLLGSAQALGID